MKIKMEHLAWYISDRAHNKLSRRGLASYSMLKELIGFRFYDVYPEEANDGIGGHYIRCFACGGGLSCREPTEKIKRVIDLYCQDCLPNPLGKKRQELNYSLP